MPHCGYPGNPKLSKRTTQDWQTLGDFSRGIERELARTI
jgi:hypothetical protein